MYLLPIFSILIIFYLREKSVVTFLLSLVVVSLVGTLFLGQKIENTDSKAFIMLAFTAIFLMLIILPWENYKNIKNIEIGNELKIRRLTKFLIYINTFTFIILLITTILTHRIIHDLNKFKYVEGASTEFYYTMLPFSTRYFILAIYLYGFAYFLIPLHFYYLSRNNKKISIICFILSLNIILYGTTYFSRAVVIQYVLLYICMYLILNKTLNKAIKKFLKKGVLAFGTILIIYFVYISTQRFEDNLSYEKTIPSSSIIQNPVYYSFVDYLSQWYFNGYDVLKDYEFKTFNGQITFQSILSLLGHLGIIQYNPQDYQALRIRLWKNNYYTFTGFTAYTIYDFGIILGFLFCFAYYYIVKKNAPINHTIKITNLFLIVLLIQIPSMAIFYSQMGELIIPFLFYMVVKGYLRVKIK